MARGFGNDFQKARLAGLAAFASLAFHALFQIGFVRAASALGSGILFYNGVAALFVSTLLGGPILLWRPLRRLGRLSFLSLHVAAASVVLVSFVVFPVTYDRSVSTFLLETLDRAPEGTGLTVDALSEDFVRRYVEEGGAVRRRVFEQGASGNLVLSEEGRAALTPRGRAVVAFGKWVMRIYGGSTLPGDEVR